MHGVSIENVQWLNKYWKTSCDSSVKEYNIMTHIVGTQTRTVLSLEAEATRLPVGEN